jgi:hypothetical protein
VSALRPGLRRRGPGVQDRLPHERGPDAPRSARRCQAISASMLIDPAEHLLDQEWVMVGEMAVERWAQLVFLLLYLDRRRFKVRIHGRPRSDRKKRFLLSAVAPSTSARHPREARPINWAQRGGLASDGETVLLTPRPHFTAPSCTLGNQVVAASDGAPFREERRPTRVCRTPGPVAVYSPKQALCELVPRIFRRAAPVARRSGLFRARYRGRAPGCGHLSAHRTFDHARRACHAMPTRRTRAQPWPRSGIRTRHE